MPFESAGVYCNRSIRSPGPDCIKPPSKCTVERSSYDMVTGYFRCTHTHFLVSEQHTGPLTRCL